MASPFEELNAFNLQQLARSGQPLQRVGEAQIGLAQYQFERQAQQQDDERRRQGRVADALTIYEKHSELQAKRVDEAFRKTVEREAAALGVEIKGKDTAALLRETKLAQEADIARMDRKKVIQALNALGAGIDPNDTTIPEENLRGLLGEAQEQRRLEFMSDEVKTKAQAEAEAIKERFESNRDTIQKAIENIDSEADQAESKLAALVKQPPQVEPARLRQRFLQSAAAQEAFATLKPAQAQLLREGDLNAALQAIYKKNENLGRSLAGALAEARALEEADLFEQRKQDILIARDQLKKRQFNKKEALYRTYGPDVFSLDTQRDVAPAAKRETGAFKLPGAADLSVPAAAAPYATVPARTVPAIAPQPGNQNVVQGLFPYLAPNMAPMRQAIGGAMDDMGSNIDMGIKAVGNVPSYLFGGPIRPVPAFRNPAASVGNMGDAYLNAIREQAARFGGAVGPIFPDFRQSAPPPEYFIGPQQ